MHFVCVGDSEADIYELFAEPLGKPGGPRADWLVRACQDRALDPKTHDEHRRLLDEVSATAVLYEVELLVRGRKAKVAADRSGRLETELPRTR